MSFEIALTGLEATNTQLDTISNNIANVSTTGFKESRTEFAAIYNGIQPGGVEVASISQNFEKNGNIVGTGRSLDLAINGNGFFQTKDTQNQTIYTRSGIFNTDRDNFIVSNTGLRLQGFTVDATNNVQQGTVGDLRVNTAAIGATATTTFDFSANLNANDTALDPLNFDPLDSNTYNSTYTTQVFDSLGNARTLTQYFIKDLNAVGTNGWQVNYAFDQTPLATVETLNFDTNGVLIPPATNTVLTSGPIVGANPLSITVNYTGMTQFGSDFGVSQNTANGNTSGDLSGLRVEDNGLVFANYTNGQSIAQGQVILANFANPQGLLPVNKTGWIQTFASGNPITGAPGTGILGELSPGALEGSNVDLTGELVNLITAQRNYQANAKTISTSDQLTQALFNAV